MPTQDLANALTGVIVFVSDYAFQVIVSFGGVAMQMSYLIPVLLVSHSCFPVLFPPPGIPN